MNKYMNFSKTRLKVKHDMRGTYSLLWTFRGARNDGLLEVAERVKEDLTEIGIFVLVHLPFEHIEKKVGKSTVIIIRDTSPVFLETEMGPVPGALYKSSLKPKPVR